MQLEMPEYPYVLSLARRLNESFTGARLVKVTVLSGPLAKGSDRRYAEFRRNLPNMTGMWQAIQVRGKYSYARVIKGKGEPVHTFMYHLNVSADIKTSIDVDISASLSGVCAKLAFEKGGQKLYMYFVDRAGRGNLYWHTPKSFETAMKKVGPNFMDMSFKSFVEVMRDRYMNEKQIAVALLNQRKLSGIGNYWRSEACYVAGIDPLKLVKEVSDDDLEELYDSLRDIFEEVMAAGGVPKHGGKYKFKIYGTKDAVVKVASDKRKVYCRA